MMNAEQKHSLELLEALAENLDDLYGDIVDEDEELAALLDKAATAIDHAIQRRDELDEEEHKAHLPKDFLTKLSAASVTCGKIAEMANSLAELSQDIEYTEDIEDVFNDLESAASAARMVADEYLALNAARAEETAPPKANPSDLERLSALLAPIFGQLQ